MEGAVELNWFEWFMYTIGIPLSYILVGICVLAAIVLPLIQAIKNPKSLVKMGIVLGTLILVFGVTYALAGDSTYGNKEATAGTSKLVGAGLLTFYVLLIGALLSIVYTEVTKAIK